MAICPLHPDSEPCPRKMGYKAAEIVAQARTDREAGRIACDAMRVIAREAGARKAGKDFAGVATATVKVMP